MAQGSRPALPSLWLQVSLGRTHTLCLCVSTEHHVSEAPQESLPELWERPSGLINFPPSPGRPPPPAACASSGGRECSGRQIRGRHLPVLIRAALQSSTLETRARAAPSHAAALLQPSHPGCHSCRGKSGPDSPTCARWSLKPPPDTQAIVCLQHAVWVTRPPRVHAGTLAEPPAGP